ncbi:MAG: biotin--[acetyl-CoA-carboxylase] ligase [Planctomycetes bacterium RBG_13_62_9]|nr:MAG: biotin--[acetyl-CoA-carboxylase] ligase [Planctomycetes bacterium RBG_13_62_9]
MPTDDRLDPDLIRTNLRTKRIGGRVLVYDHTSSTNDVAAEYARNPDNDGLAVFAEEQTAGRGRAGATWHSHRGDSLLFSVVLIDCGISNELLSLTFAVAVAEAIGQVGACRTGIKWPNDITLDGRKVAGILLESKAQRAQDSVKCQGSSFKPANFKLHSSHSPAPAVRPASCAVHVIGIGINCHQTLDSFPSDLHTTATSLDLAGGTRCRRVTVAKRVLTSLDHWLRVAKRSGKQVIDTWSRLSTQLGQRIALSYDGKRFTGNCIGVDPEKGLILQLDRGGVRMFDAAHTHIIK